jgi:hypothetical protein
MQEYLGILLSNAKQLGLPLAEKPFYSEVSAIEAVLQARTIKQAEPIIKMPSYWRSLYEYTFGVSH